MTLSSITDSTNHGSTSLNTSIEVRLSQKFTNQQFDFFVFKNDDDFSCYQFVLKTKNWGFHCPFLIQEEGVFLDQILATYSIYKANTDMQKLQNIRLVFDNSPFPYGLNKNYEALDLFILKENMYTNSAYYYTFSCCLILIFSMLAFILIFISIKLHRANMLSFKSNNGSGGNNNESNFQMKTQSSQQLKKMTSMESQQPYKYNLLGAISNNDLSNLNDGTRPPSIDINNLQREISLTSRNQFARTVYGQNQQQVQQQQQKKLKEVDESDIIMNRADRERLATFKRLGSNMSNSETPNFISVPGNQIFNYNQNGDANTNSSAQNNQSILNSANNLRINRTIYSNTTNSNNSTIPQQQQQQNSSGNQSNNRFEYDQLVSQLQEVTPNLENIEEDDDQIQYDPTS
eukprot:403354441